MTAEDREFLNTIQSYADEVLADVDPEKVQVSEQLQRLRPILQELAMKHKMNVEDVFIKYMDLATEKAIEYDQKIKADFGDLMKPGDF